MKTTIKLTPRTAIVVAPAAKANGIFVGLTKGEFGEDSFILSADQCGALIFGIEQALEVIDQRHRAALEAIRVAA